LERVREEVVEEHESHSSEIATIEEVTSEIKKICSCKEKLKQFTFITLGKIRDYFDAYNIKGDTAEDVLQNLFIKFLKGKRKWYKNNGRTFENQLYMAIVSVIRNEFNKHYERDNTEEKNKSKSPKIYSIFDDEGSLIENYLKDDSQDFETFENEKELLESDTAAGIKKIYKELENDEEAYLVFDELLKLGNSDIKVAESLGMPIEDVRKAKKRIRRKSKNIITLN
jgi:RNA polymerase sigma factor (sigma-70 family)